MEETYKTAESPEFTGKAVVGLACDKNRMAKSGKILITSDLALEYGFTDSGGYFFNEKIVQIFVLFELNREA